MNCPFFFFHSVSRTDIEDGGLLVLLRFSLFYFYIDVGMTRVRYLALVDTLGTGTCTSDSGCVMIYL